MTISDRGARGERADASGAAVKAILSQTGFTIDYYEVIPDERQVIEARLRYLADDHHLDLVVTTGGTGLSPRDVTPEATLAVVDKVVPGMAEAMRAASMAKTPHAMISRAVAGVRGRTLIVNLPGSPGGARENLQVLLPALDHAIDKIQGDPSECGALPLGGHEKGK